MLVRRVRAGRRGGGRAGWVGGTHVDWELSERGGPDELHWIELLRNFLVPRRFERVKAVVIQVHVLHTLRHRVRRERWSMTRRGGAGARERREEGVRAGARARAARRSEVVWRPARVDAVLLERGREVVHGEHGALAALRVRASKIRQYGARRERTVTSPSELGASSSPARRARARLRESATHLGLALPRCARTCSRTRATLVRSLLPRRARRSSRGSSRTRSSSSRACRRRARCARTRRAPAGPCGSARSGVLERVRGDRADEALCGEGEEALAVGRSRRGVSEGERERREGAREREGRCGEGGARGRGTHTRTSLVSKPERWR